MNIKKYKQLPLTGGKEDYQKSISELHNFKIVIKALNNFFKDNEMYNPRQLEYILLKEINDIVLDELIDWHS